MFEVPKSLGERPGGGPSFGPLRRKHQPVAPLALLLVLPAFLLLGCGLVGGNGEEETQGGSPEGVRPEILTKLAQVSDPEAAAAAETEDKPEDEATPEPEASPVPEPTPEPKLAVENAEQARDLVWVDLSQCFTLESSGLEATLIAEDWFVKGSKGSEAAPEGEAAPKTGSPQEIGLWKVDAVTGVVEPYDILSRQWLSVLESQCSPESLAALFTPSPVPTATPVIVDATGAVAAVWSYLAQCSSTLSTENFDAIFNPAQGQWVVITKAGSATDFGTWAVDAASGSLQPYAGLSRQWDSVVKLQCDPEAMAALSTPTPVPTPTPAVSEASHATTTLWSYLVNCAPAMLTTDLEATLNPAKGEWIVITKPGSALDYGVWTIRSDGSISPANGEAARRDQQAIAGTC